jgi:hypothetical protein
MTLPVSPLLKRREGRTCLPEVSLPELRVLGIPTRTKLAAETEDRELSRAVRERSERYRLEPV